MRPEDPASGDVNPLARYYADRASEYEQIYDKPERQEELRALRALVSTAFKGRDVLELACGTGYWTQFIARAADSIVASDINSEVLQIARSKPMGSCRVAFRQSDAYKPHCPSQPYSAAFAGFWWSHLPRTRVRDFLLRLQAVLAVGAQVMFIDNRYAEGSSTPITRTDDEGNTYQLRQLRNGAIHEVLKNFPTELELQEAVADFGDAVQIESWHHYWILQYSAISPAP